MRFIKFNEPLELHCRIMADSNGVVGIRDLGALASALEQPRMTFAQRELYSTIVDKTASLGFSLIRNHPFLDGNKRTGHVAMETFPVLNGHEIAAEVDEQERVILQVASGELDRKTFTDWLQMHVVPCRAG